MMCLIMTDAGWVNLGDAVVCVNDNQTEGESAFYKGHFPTIEIVNLHNEMKEQMKYFDDGIRMVYGGQDRKVYVQNAEPIHPIKTPPDGWHLVAKDGRTFWEKL